LKVISTKVSHLSSSVPNSQFSVLNWQQFLFKNSIQQKETKRQMPAVVRRSWLQNSDVHIACLHDECCLNYFKLLAAQKGSTNIRSGGRLLNEY